MSFQPTQISGCALWLDAADSTTFTFSGLTTTISTWSDKSGNGRNATGNTGSGTYATNIINSLPCVQITPTGNMVSSVPAGTFSAGFSLFCVFQKTGANSANGDTLLGRSAVNFPSPWDTLTTNTVTARNVGSAAGYWGSNAAGQTIFRRTTPTIWCVVVSSSTPQTWNETINGTLTIYTLNTTVGSPAYGDNAASIWIGTRADGFTTMTGNIGEIVCYNGALVDSQRQQVEGYLAWKWGLQTSLPATHPYYNFPPTSLSIQSYTELNLVNTSVQSGTITLPSATIPGRILTFKDIYGTFSNSTFTISTSGADRFEDNTNSITLNNSFGSYTFAEGTDNKWYTIGGSYMDTAAVSSITTIGLFGNFISSGSVVASTLQFKDTLTQSTNTSFYISSLLFYSSPTNYFVVGPTKAPKWSFLRTRGPFLPNQVAGLSLWFDASDPNTYMNDGPVISSWTSKGTNRISVTQNTNSNRPRIVGQGQNGLDVMRFVNSASASYVNLTNTSVASNVITTGNSIFLFVVHNPTRSNNTVFSYTSATNRISLTTPEFTTPNYFIRWDYTNATTGRLSYNVGGIGYISEGFKLECAYTSNGSSGTSGYRKNGVLLASQAGINATGFTTNTLTIGSYAPTETTYYYQSDIAEILSYNQAISDTATQQIEGYLAWKWGLVGLLSTTHLYKLAPP